VLLQRLLMSPIGPLIGRRFSRERMGRTFGRIFGINTQPTEQELDAFWAMMITNNVPAVMHRLIRYMAERGVDRDGWGEAMRRSVVPLREIDGAEDPISGMHMVERYCDLIPEVDTVLRRGIGDYPLVEPAEVVLEHYLAFRSRVG